MADTGWMFPGTALGTWAGGNDWTTPNNAKLDDVNEAAWIGAKFDNSEQGDGPELRMTNFGFSIPAGYVIQGIETEISGRTDSAVVSELVYLTVTSTGKRNEWTNIQVPETTHVYGSLTDRWGAVLTPDIVNTSTFGWIFMPYDDVSPLNTHINYMKMKIYYEPPPPIIISMGT